jgi:fluoride ion exporter CrcB/FEX
MKDKIKTYGCLLVTLLGTFVLGLYTAITKHTDQLIEPHQWVLTSIFTLVYLLLVIEKMTKEN